MWNSNIMKDYIKRSQEAEQKTKTVLEKATLKFFWIVL